MADIFLAQNRVMERLTGTDAELGPGKLVVFLFFELELPREFWQRDIEHRSHAFGREQFFEAMNFSAFGLAADKQQVRIGCGEQARSGVARGGGEGAGGIQGGGRAREDCGGRGVRRVDARARICGRVQAAAQVAF